MHKYEMYIPGYRSNPDHPSHPIQSTQSSGHPSYCSHSSHPCHPNHCWVIPVIQVIPFFLVTVVIQVIPVIPVILVIPAILGILVIPIIQVLPAILLPNWSQSSHVYQSFLSSLSSPGYPLKPVFPGIRVIFRHPSEPSHSHNSGQLSHPSYLMVIPVNQGT